MVSIYIIHENTTSKISYRNHSRLIKEIAFDIAQNIYIYVYAGVLRINLHSTNRKYCTKDKCDQKNVHTTF